MVASITDTHGIIALAAGALAVLALIGCIALALSVRRLRRAQRIVLGEGERTDLVAHAAGMREAFELLREHIDASAARVEGRVAGAEGTLRGALSHRALVRYDAYNELSGQQSMSIALLDDEQSGIVLSCIHHREQARVYGKQLNGGRSEQELSPEEAEAVRLALSRRRPEDGAGEPA